MDMMQYLSDTVKGVKEISGSQIDNAQEVGGNQNMSGNSTGFVSDLFGFGSDMVNAYTDGKAIYDSIPFTGDAHNRIKDQQVKSITVVKNPVVVSDTEKATSFLDENKFLILGGVGALGLLVGVVLLVRK